MHLTEEQTAMAIGELSLSSYQKPSFLESDLYTDQHMRLRAARVGLNLVATKGVAEIKLSFDFPKSTGLLQIDLLSDGGMLNASSVLLGETNTQPHLGEKGLLC